MKVGQKVMLIAPWPSDLKLPPLGALGEITEPMDSDGDYFVLFPDWPCPYGEADWYAPHWALIPIDDGERAQTMSDERMLTC